MKIEVTFADPAKLARFLSQLVREGVTFTVRSAIESWTVTLTGGF